MDSLVSVVIPTFNHAGVVVQTVESVLAQTHPNIEILIADDGSTDATESVIRAKYGPEPADRKIRYLKQANAGSGAARNLGLRSARGEYIALLGSDDVWHPRKLELQLAALRALPGAGLIWSDFDTINGRGAKIHDRRLRSMYEAYRFFPSDDDLFDGSVRLGDGSRVYWADDFFSPISLGNLMHTSTVVLTRERQRSVGYFAEVRVGEDHDYFLRACKAGPVAFLDAVTTSYRIGQDDAISANGRLYSVAEAFIGILERTFREDGERIRLPRSIVRECFADAYARAGRERLIRGDARIARSHLLRSLGRRPLHGQTAKYLAAAYVPAVAREWAFVWWESRKNHSQGGTYPGR